MANHLRDRLKPLLVILPAILPIILVLAATWKLTLADRIIARGDLLLYFYPLRDYASAAIRAGRLPLWNPYTFMGAPFLANSQVGFFYPLNVLLAWLPAERAVSWSIVLHLAIAAVGMYALARRGMRLSRIASLAGAVTYGLGGYLGSQVEHVNQLQVLAWLPLQVPLVLGARSARPKDGIRRIAALALLIALQILAGHTQSLYICLVTTGVVAMLASLAQIIAQVRVMARLRSERTPDNANSLSTPPASRVPMWLPRLIAGLLPLAILLAAVAVAVLLSTAQLLPTLELASQSARSGGLPFNEVGSFSWRPWVAARALLPPYGDPLFPEYVVYFGASGLALALLGAVSEQRTHTKRSELGTRWVAVALGLLGLLLALGVATPVFGVLYRFAPGFNLFRAQARWLVMAALGGSMLVGLGVQALQQDLSIRQRRAWLLGWAALLIMLSAGLVLGARFSPEPEYRSLPAIPVLTAWIVSALAVTVAIAAVTASSMRQTSNVRRQPTPASRIPSFVLRPSSFVVLLLVELFAAAQFQPYSRAADQEALTDLRPATAHLLAGEDMRAGDAAGAQRILALSGLFFDPGDLPEQTLIYQSLLSPDELYDRIIASKHKEILSPNLSLYYRLPGVDGYDGGLLPLKRYAQFVDQFAPRDKGRTSDGRLREFLSAVPDDRWLAQMAVRYVIADKTRDVFIDNVYYDLQFGQTLSDSAALPLDAFEATALGLVFNAPSAHPDDILASASVHFADSGQQSFEVRATGAVTQPYFGVRLSWGGRRTPDQLILKPVTTGVSLLGMTSIDAQTGAFLSQPVRGQHDMRLAYSGDVKIYENLRAAPRAFLAGLNNYSELAGDGVQSASAGSIESIANAGTVKTIEERPERLVFDVQAPAPAWFVLRDACYPGWVAQVDGAPAPVVCADTLFRAVQIAPGSHRITMTYEPISVTIGALLSAGGLVVWLALCIAGLRKSGRSAPAAVYDD